MNSRLRKVTRNRGQLRSEQAALNVLYPAVRNLQDYRAREPASGARAGNNPCRHSRPTSTDESRPHDRHDHLHRGSDAPVLAGRSAPTVSAPAEQLGLPHRELSLDDPAALDGVDLVLNATGPFLHTSAPLAKARLAAGVHYLDIGIELQAFRALYDLDQGAQDAWVTSMPGTGFGVVATNCLAPYVSAAVGGAAILEVASRAAVAQAGPGMAASRSENMPFGGWIRRADHLESYRRSAMYRRA